MARIDTLGNFLTDVADAIREKKGTSETIQASQFDTEIANLPGGGFDWSAIGYSDIPSSLIDDYNYSKDIYDNWENVSNLTNKFLSDSQLVYMPYVNTSSATNTSSMFQSCKRLMKVPLLDISNSTNTSNMFQSCIFIKEVPQFDTSKVKSMRNMFNDCPQLINIPQFSTIKVTNIQNMFAYCSNLTDTSLDNILKMCININPDYASTKTLAILGLSSSSYPVSRIQALPSYQDFIDAGWTIGY